MDIGLVRSNIFRSESIANAMQVFGCLNRYNRKITVTRIRKESKDCEAPYRILAMNQSLLRGASYSVKSIHFESIDILVIIINNIEEVNRTIAKDDC